MDVEDNIIITNKNNNDFNIDYEGIFILFY